MNNSDHSYDLLRISKNYQRILHHPSPYTTFNHATSISLFLFFQKFLSILSSLDKLPSVSPSILEVGCGDSLHILSLIQAGYSPRDIYGLDILPERVAKSKSVVPCPSNIFLADITQDHSFQDESFDVIYQCTVFSSFEKNTPALSRCCDTITSLLKPNGLFISYDLSFPSINPHVHAITSSALRRNLPKLKLVFNNRLTTIPPLNRAFNILPLNFHIFLNLLPFPRSHSSLAFQKI